MKTFPQSSVTKALLLTAIAQVLVKLEPQLRNHAIDLWALSADLAVILAGLFVNALRPDIDAPGFNWFNKKDD